MKGYLVIFVLIPFANVYGQASVVEQDSLMMEQVTSPDGQVKVQMMWPEVLFDEIYEIQLKFLDPNTDELLSDILYSVGVIQGSHPIEYYHDEPSSDGTASFEVMFLETGPASVEVRILGIGENIFKDYESAGFPVEVVPEFATLTLMVMALSFVAVLAVQRLKNASQIQS